MDSEKFACVLIRAVKVKVLIYEIIVPEMNAIKYFNAVNATLFTSGVRKKIQLLEQAASVSLTSDHSMSVSTFTGAG